LRIVLEDAALFSGIGPSPVAPIAPGATIDPDQPTP